METNKSKNWFLTINEGAKCYNQLSDILKSLNLKHYAYIYHNCEEWENGNKNKHIHICLEYQNQTRFSTLQNKFEGAHIEPMKYKNVSYQYLIHKNDPDKTPYEIDSVICDSKDYYLSMLDNDEYLYLDSETIIEEIESGNNTIKGLIKTFGINQVNHKLGLIKSLINETETFTKQEILERENYELRHESVQLKSKIISLQERIKKLEDELGYLPF